MSGKLTIIGLGPGSAQQLTHEASVALQAAEVVFGYEAYLDRVPERAGQRREPSDNREELGRASNALREAFEGASVAIVSGGDPGVFAMATAVCEALEHGPASWRDLEIAVVPGITAMLAVAARVGAPLGHDFCALSLSDNLKPWAIVEQRLQAAATAGFVIAVYNPLSRSRPWQLGRAFEVLKGCLPSGTPVIFGRAIGRVDEQVWISTISTADPRSADMSTCVIIGTADTRILERPKRAPLIYTPRSVRAVAT